MTWLVMRHWPDGYAYRIPMPLRLFPAADAAALLVAVASIGSQALAAARRPPSYRCVPSDEARRHLLDFKQACQLGRGPGLGGFSCG